MFGCVPAAPARSQGFGGETELIALASSQRHQCLAVQLVVIWTVVARENRGADAMVVFVGFVVATVVQKAKDDGTMTDERSACDERRLVGQWKQLLRRCQNSSCRGAEPHMTFPLSVLRAQPSDALPSCRGRATTKIDCRIYMSRRYHHYCYGLASLPQSCLSRKCWVS